MSASTAAAAAAPKNLTKALVSLADLNAFLLTDAPALHVLFFYATWDEPSKPGGAMDTLVSKLVELHPAVRFARVEAEEAAEVSEQFEVSVAPTFLFFKSKTQVDRVEGADAAGVTQRVERWEKQALPGGAGAGAASAPALPKSLQDLDKELDRLVTAAPVMVFMKGTPDEPRCKFSRQLVELLRGVGCAFGAFDILTSEAVRQGLKDKFSWPTFPQLYVNGKLVGGIDIAKELHEAGELTQLLPKPPVGSGAAAAGSSPAADAARARTQEAVASHPAVLLMKGTVDNAACGFSERMVELLAAANVDFKAIDVLADPALREAAKALTGFTTFPQLYVRGELVGGVEAVTRVQEANPGKPLADALGAPTREPLEARLIRLINAAPAVLFMKGTAAEPRCGFSARAVDALRTAGLDVSNPSLFSSFDILRDGEVREGLKKFSNWPTFPQFYCEGKLIGGLDILNELQAEGELKELLGGLKPRGA